MPKTTKKSVKKAKKTKSAGKVRTVTKVVYRDAPKPPVSNPGQNMESTLTETIGLGAKTLIGVGLLGGLAGAFNK